MGQLTFNTNIKTEKRLKPSYAVSWMNSGTITNPLRLEGPQICRLGQYRVKMPDSLLSELGPWFPSSHICGL